MLNYFIISFLSIILLIIICFAIKSKRPFFTLFFNALIGLLMLCIIDFTVAITGVFIPINQYTVAGTSIFGIPAVILFLILKFIFI